MSGKVIEAAKDVSKLVKDHRHEPNKFVAAVGELSEVVTTHGMAPASFACGVAFSFLALFQFKTASAFMAYGGLGLGVALIIIGVGLYMWKVARDTPRAFPEPPPLDPQFVETLNLLRRVVEKDLLGDEVEQVAVRPPEPPEPKA
jgi:hypothetical protein